MSTQPIGLEGLAYRQGDQLTVYLKLDNGRYAKLTGDAKQAKRNWGRFTRVAQPKLPKP